MGCASPRMSASVPERVDISAPPCPRVRPVVGPGVMLEILDAMRNLPPNVTIGEFVALSEKMVAHAQCLRCGKPISRFRVADDQPWVHDDLARSRGCRAATFDGDDWDETLPGKWLATPEPE